MLLGYHILQICPPFDTKNSFLVYFICYAHLWLQCKCAGDMRDRVVCSVYLKHIEADAGVIEAICGEVCRCSLCNIALFCRRYRLTPQAVGRGGRARLHFCKDDCFPIAQHKINLAAQSPIVFCKQNKAAV